MKRKSLLFVLPLIAMSVAGCTSTPVTPKKPDPTPVVKTLQSISYSGEYKKNYVAGESFDKTGLVIKAKYSDGTEVEVTNYQIYPEGALPAAATKVTAVYTEGNVSKSVDIPVTVTETPDPGKEIQSIRITGSMKKLTYKVGEPWDPTGLSVTALYTDGTDGTVDAGAYNWIYSPEKPALGVTAVSVKAKLIAGDEKESDVLDVTGIVVTDEPPVVDTITPEQAEALMDEAGDGKVVEGLKKVKGICGKVSYEAQYSQYTGGFDGVDNFKLQFTDKTDILGGKSPEGMEIVVEGYLEKYNGKYQLSYLPASASPTGEKFTPYLISAKEVQHEGVLESISVSENHRTFEQYGTFVGETVTAHYSDGNTATVQAQFSGYDLTTTGTQTVTVSYTEGGVTQTTTYEITVTPATEKSSLQRAYEAAAALEKGGVTTESYEFSGVIVAKRLKTDNNDTEYFVQDGSYGLDVFSSKAEIANFAVGKEVSVKATLQNYNNTLETKVISESSVIGDGTLPASTTISSLDGLKAAKQNVLVNTEGTIKSITAGGASVVGAIDSTKDTTIILTVNGDDLTVFIKKYTFADKVDLLNSLEVGNEITITDAVSGIFNTTNQILICNNSEIVKGGEPVVRTLSSIAVTGTAHRNFYVNDNFVGEEVTATYSDGSTKKVTATYSGYDMSKAGTYEVKASYTEGDITKEDTYEITVETAPSRVVGDFYRVSSQAEITAGKYLIVYEPEGESAKTFSGVDAVNGFVDATATSGHIAAADTLVQIELETMDGGFAIKVLAGENAGKYMVGVSGENKINFDTEKQLNTVEHTDAGDLIVSNTSTIMFNKASNQMRFRYYKPGSSQQPVCLYKMEEGDVPPVEQVLDSITVSENHRSFDVNAEFVKETVTAHYTGGKADADVTNSAVFGAVDMSTAGTKTVSVSYTEGGITKETSYQITVSTPTPAKSSLQIAYEAGAALTSGHTDLMEFTGVVTGLQGSSYFLQDGDYTIEVYNCATADVVVGKKLTVKAYIQNYSGLIETWYDSKDASTKPVITKVEDGTVVTPAAISSKTALDATRLSNLISAESLTVVSKDSSWANKSTDGKVTVKIGEDTETVTLIMSKYCTSAETGALLNGLVAGDEVSVSKAIVAQYKGVIQISLLDDTVLSKKEAPVKEIKSIAIGGDMTNKSYSVGSDWNPAGLSVVATYEDDSTALLDSSLYELSYNPAKANATTVTSVVVTATLKAGGVDPATKTVTGITVSGETKVYSHVTSISDIETGTYIISAKVGDDYYGIANAITLTSSKIKNCGTVNVSSSGTVSSTDGAAFALTITVNEDSIYIKDSNNKYLAYSSSTNFALSDSPYEWCLAEGVNGTIRIVSKATNTRALSYRAGDQNCFGPYSTSNITATSTEYFDLELFKA